jgi:hypothetical protein
MTFAPLKLFQARVQAVTLCCTTQELIPNLFRKY